MTDWVSVCKEENLTPGTGVCVLLDNNEQVALFKMSTTNDIYAISNYDPFGKANVLSRGITGSIGDAIVVASPLYKQHFNLATGECLEDSEVSIKAYPVRIVDGDVQVQS